VKSALLRSHNPITAVDQELGRLFIHLRVKNVGTVESKAGKRGTFRRLTAVFQDALRARKDDRQNHNLGRQFGEIAPRSSVWSWLSYRLIVFAAAFGTCALRPHLRRGKVSWSYDSLESCEYRIIHGAYSDNRFLEEAVPTILCRQPIQFA